MALTPLQAKVAQVLFQASLEGRWILDEDWDWTRSLLTLDNTLGAEDLNDYPISMRVASNKVVQDTDTIKVVGRTVCTVKTFEIVERKLVDGEWVDVTTNPTKDRIQQLVNLAAVRLAAEEAEAEAAVSTESVLDRILNGSL